MVKCNESIAELVPALLCWVAAKRMLGRNVGSVAHLYSAAFQSTLCLAHQGPLSGVARVPSTGIFITNRNSGTFG